MTQSCLRLELYKNVVRKLQVVPDTCGSRCMWVGRCTKLDPKARKINRRTLCNFTLWLQSIILNPINSTQSCLPFYYKIILSTPFALLPLLLWVESLCVGQGGSVKAAEEKPVNCCSEQAWKKDQPLSFKVKNEKRWHLPWEFMWYLLNLSIFLLFHSYP